MSNGITFSHVTQLYVSVGQTSGVKSPPIELLRPRFKIQEAPTVRTFRTRTEFSVTNPHSVRHLIGMRFPGIHEFHHCCQFVETFHWMNFESNVVTRRHRQPRVVQTATKLSTAYHVWNSLNSTDPDVPVRLSQDSRNARDSHNRETRGQWLQ